MKKLINKVLVKAIEIHLDIADKQYKTQLKFVTKLAKGLDFLVDTGLIPEKDAYIVELLKASWPIEGSVVDYACRSWRDDIHYDLMKFVEHRNVQRLTEELKCHYMEATTKIQDHVFSKMHEMNRQVH